MNNKDFKQKKELMDNYQKASESMERKYPFGIPYKSAFGLEFWTGFCLGVLVMCSLTIIIIALGGIK